VSRRPASADVFQAIADPTRRQILGLLLERDEPTATELAAPFGCSQSAISQHLKVLRDADLVTVRQVGRERRYRLQADPLREVSEWVSEYERFWGERLRALESLLAAETPDPDGGG
jgi:DNA-binding transcriptional ArsR family regulator